MSISPSFKRLLGVNNITTKKTDRDHYGIGNDIAFYIGKVTLDR